MNHIPVSSSNVSSIAYENGVLEVIFHNGYRYQWNIPESIYRELMAASSKGTFIHTRLKSKYGERKV
ncbi:MAG: KTSC domain-containing protein [Treponema sp.]|nr:KTSC domain-containing protein [Treponema sp.]MCL2251795.1 KTSC domain-containing protein [Treponema sp.]